MAGTSATLALLLKLHDEATPGFSRMATAVNRNRSSFNALASGANTLSSSFLGLGVALSQMNNEAARNIGQTAIMVGGILSAVGSSLQFIVAIGKLIVALRKLRDAQILVQATNPLLWVPLLAGLAIGAGAIAFTNKLEASQARASRSNITIINNNNNIRGSLVTERELTQMNRQYIIKKGEQNGSSGVR